MSNALEQFRAQRKAAEEVQTRLHEISVMLVQLREQARALSDDRELRAVLSSERQWLWDAQQTIAEVRALREDEMRRYWPGVWRRWAIALVFALWSAFAAGAGYGWTAAPCAQDIATSSENQKRDCEAQPRKDC